MLASSLLELHWSKYIIYAPDPGARPFCSLPGSGQKFWPGRFLWKIRIFIYFLDISKQFWWSSGVLDQYMLKVHVRRCLLKKSENRPYLLYIAQVYQVRTIIVTGHPRVPCHNWWFWLRIIGTFIKTPKAGFPPLHAYKRANEGSPWSSRLDA